MHLAGNLFYGILIFLLMAVTANAQQGKNKSSRSSDSSKIETEHVAIDFGTAAKFQSARNIARTPEGVRAADPAKRAVLVSRDIAVPVDSVAPFLAVGSRWVVDQSEHKERVQLEIRSAADQQQWTEWRTVDRDAHLTTTPDTLVGTLQFLSKSTRFIQFRVTLSGVEPLRSLRFSFTSPGATPPETLQKLKEKATRYTDRPKSGNRQYPMPDYVTRTDWDCPDGQQPSGPYPRTEVTHQIVHHSAGTNTSSDWPAVVRSIWDYHVNTNGWSDIGYNWLVDPNGVLYQGRGWIDGDDEVQGAHFCGTNSNTMGVCVLGNFEETSPSSDALDKLEDLLAWKSDEKNIDPLAESYHSSSDLTLDNISGHRDGCSTLCPGENLYVRLPEIRQNVSQKIGETAETENLITLESNYPNPFSTSTTISFVLARAGNVRVTIWDVAGRMVREVANQFYDADRHEVSWDAADFASGIYFCRLEFEDQSVTQKMVLLK